MYWFEGSITDAITAAQQRGVLFVVYIRGDDDISNQMDATWEDEQVSSICKESGMVAVRFNSNSDECKQFSRIYPVICVPCVSFISPDNGIPLEGTAGHLNPSDFKQRIQKVIQMSKQTTSTTAAGQSSTLPPTAATTPSSAQAPGQSAAPAASPSQEPKPAELTKLEKAARLRQKMEEIHKKKESQTKEEAKQKEVERRKIGQAVQKAKVDRTEQNAKRVADEMRREKEEAKLAKDRVREQIARDRVEKQSRYDADRIKREKSQAEKADKEAAMTKAAPPKRNIDMGVACIQFRFPDGSTLTNQFDAQATLQEAKQFLIENKGKALPAFTMSTTFPRRRFTDMNATFQELELVPSAAIVVVPGHDTNISSSSSSAITPSVSNDGFLAMLFAPLIFIWNFLYNFIFGRPATPSGGPRPEDGQVPSQQSTATGATNTTGARPKSSQVRRRTPVGEGSVARREGNIHRFVSGQDADNQDENNTWNGNSTQQM